MKAPSAMLVVLAASHAVNDWLAGWLLGSALPEATSWDRLPWLAIYAALAFAGQLPAAWIVERAPRPDRWLALALTLMVGVVPAAQISPGLAVIVSGVASAFVHVAGGALALSLPRGERALGWFSAPGVLGLTVGGLLGQTIGPLAWWSLLPPLALLAGWWFLRAAWPASNHGHAPASIPRSTFRTPHSEVPAALEAHDGLMLLLLLALTLRSAVWDLVQISDFAEPRALLALACSAAAGKIFGGWMSARHPGVRPIAGVLIAACALLQWGRERLALVCLGVLLLQSAIPASIVLLHRSFGASRARAVAYGLGLTVALGGLVLPFRGTLPLMALLLMLVALGMLGRGWWRRGLAST